MSRQDTKYIYVTIQSQVSTMYVLVSIIFATTQLPKKKSFTTCSKAKQDGLFKRLKKLSAFLSPLKGLLCEPSQSITFLNFHSCIVYNFLVEIRNYRLYRTESSAKSCSYAGNGKRFKELSTLISNGIVVC